MGSINSYPQYREYFGFPINGGTPSTGIVYAIYTIGNLVGSFAAGPACDTFGECPIHCSIWPDTYSSRTSLGHVLWSTHNSYWGLHPSSFRKSRHVHGRTIHSGFWRCYLSISWTRIRFRDGSSSLSWDNDWHLQHFLLHWWYSWNFCALRYILYHWNKFLADSHLASNGIFWCCACVLFALTRDT